jgi:isoleucyl-tRNA synthetase
MYVSGKSSSERLSAQSSMSEIAVEMTACIAPILSFTCEEVWNYLQQYNLVKEPSVFLYELDQTPPSVDQDGMNWWDKIFLLRGEVIKIIESARKAGVIGHSLDCRVTLETEDATWKAIIEESINKKRGNDLASILIVSDVRLEPIADAVEAQISPLIPGIKVGVTKAGGEKCPRCWHYHEQVEQPDHDLCPRCEEVLETEGISVTE